MGGFDLGSIGMSALSNGFDMLSNYVSAKQNYGYARKLNEQQFGFQQKLQKQQNDFNLDMWNKENEYNTAKAQVERLREAGLNPSMVFGQNSGTASPLVSSSPSVPNSAVPDFMKPVSFSDALNGFLRTEVANKELKVRSDMLDRQLKREDERIENERKKIESDVRLNEIIGREKNQNIELSKEQANVLRTSIKQMNKQIDVYDKQIENYDAEIAEKTALAEKAREEGRFVEYRAITERMNAISQRITANATSALTKQQIKVGESVVNLNKQQANHLVQQIRTLKQTEKLNNIELDWRGKLYKADFELKQGQLRITKIQGDIADATQYAEIANAYISTVDNAAKTVSDAAGAAFDVYTFGAGSKLKFGSVENQSAQTSMYRRFAETNSPVSVSGFTLGK